MRNESDLDLGSYSADSQGQPDSGCHLKVEQDLKPGVYRRGYAGDVNLGAISKEMKRVGTHREEKIFRT